MGKFEVFRGENDMWFFRLRARNGKIIAQSEGYTRKRNAINGIYAIQECADISDIVFLDK